MGENNFKQVVEVAHLDTGMIPLSLYKVAIYRYFISPKKLGDGQMYPQGVVQE